MGFMGLTNSILTLTALALLAGGIYHAGIVYTDAQRNMRPYLETIEQGLKDHEPD